MNVDLHRIARLNLLQELRDSAASGIDLNAVDEFGSTPLHYSVAHKNVDVALELVRLCADVTAQNREGQTALHSAVEYGLYDVAEAIVTKDRRVIHIADKHGNEPLWTAAFNARGHYEFVELLLRCGADATHTNNVGLRPLDVPERLGDRLLGQIMQNSVQQP
jgi:uncharacterized protein